MKIKHLISSLLLAGVMSLGVGATFGVRHEAANVSAATQKQLVVKFGNQGNWNQANAKLGVYVWNNSGNTWTNLVSLDSSKNIYVLNYTLEGTPNNLIISRQNPIATVGSFDTSWAQSSDLSFNEATYIYINGWNITSTSGWTVSAQVRSSTVPSFGPKQTISTIGLNDSGNPEVSGKVSLEENEEFKMLAGDGVWSGYYGVADGLDDYFTGGSKTERSDQNPNIVCKQAGDYDFFFDTETKRLWITNDALVAADGWAKLFINNVVCDSTGASLPTGWSANASYYAGISGDAKDIVYGANANVSGSRIEQAVAKYDYAVAHHSSLTRFVVNHSGTPRSVRATSTPIAISPITNSSATVVVIVVTLVSLTAIGSFVYIRSKRKEN